MIEITYLDAYKTEKHISYDNFDAFNRAFLGCITLPDYLPVTKVLINGHPLDYQGQIGDLYKGLNALDLSSYL